MKDHEVNRKNMFMFHLTVNITCRYYTLHNVERPPKEQEKIIWDNYSKLFVTLQPLVPYTIHTGSAGSAGSVDREIRISVLTGPGGGGQ